MEKNNNSNPSVCRKIRQALASNPALRAIHRISSYHQPPKPVTTDSNSPSSSPTKTSIQTKPPLPRNHKVNTEGSGAITITFDYSTPKTIENGNSAASSVHGQGAKVASPVVGNSERATKVAAKAEPQPRHIKQEAKAGDAFKGVHSEAPRGSMGAQQYGHGEQHSEQQGKKSVDINDTINEYIKRTKEKIRTVSNIGRGQNNPASDQVAHGTSKKEDHKDHFADFIHHAKKKFRTTTIVEKTSSLKRG